MNKAAKASVTLADVERMLEVAAKEFPTSDGAKHSYTLTETGLQLNLWVDKLVYPITLDEPDEWREPHKTLSWVMEELVKRK
jgi:hypothetical protein